MKSLLFAFAASFVVSVSAANFRWTVDFDASSDPFGVPGDPDNGWVATLTMNLYEGIPSPYITMNLSPFYLPGPDFAAGFVRDADNAGAYGIWIQDWLTQGVPYAMDPSYAVGAEGRLVGLAPSWVTPQGITNGAHYRARWGAPEEWVTPPPIDPPPIDPPDGGGGGGGGDQGGDDGGGVIPEPSTYALLSALGLLGLAAGRRLCHA